MHELLPENWPDLMAEDESQFYAIFGKKKPPPVTDILTWCECYTSLVSVVSTFVPEFMAYMSTIIKCSKRFEGLGWLTYDRAFRRKAATLKNLHWAQTDGTLFSLAFTGKAKQASVCDLCFSSNHPTFKCPEAFSQSTAQWGMQPFIGASSLQRQPPTGSSYTRKFSSNNTCGLYNSRNGPQSCTYGDKCKFQHVCSACKGNHPRSECTKPQPKRLRNQ